MKRFKKIAYETIMTGIATGAVLVLLSIVRELTLKDYVLATVLVTIYRIMDCFFTLKLYGKQDS